jgi:hypothetical protein
MAICEAAEDLVRAVNIYRDISVDIQSRLIDMADRERSI